MAINNPVDSSIFDLVTTIIPDPAVGDDIVWACPDNSRIEILYLGFVFATDANAADRYITIYSTTPALGQLMGASAIVQTASLTWGRAFVAGLPQEVDHSAINVLITPISPNLILEPGDNLETGVHNIQATDHIYSIITRYRQWIIA